ncbi:MAG: Gfo/Idh/MocA family oxidoreductase [Proteobacteria bacterium]|nr:Gfo/Idh/MocA family oxidoreductase [Pseudomonadota bacterium]
MKNFVLLGAAGFVAPRHMRAIRDTGNSLVAAMDKHDAVGLIDSYFPNSAFFVEFERLDRHVEKLRRMGDERKVHYVSIASPNYLHDAHIRFALRVGTDAICEKPLVLNPWNIDALKEIEQESGKKVNTVLQLRHHPSIIALKQKVDASTIHHPPSTDCPSPLAPRPKYDIDLTYITSRGRWYLVSWKGDLAKSGGLATNIGIHFFDMLQWIFGGFKSNIVHISEPLKAAGFLELQKARIRWFLSIDSNDLPAVARNTGKTTYRSITIDQEELEFSEGFADLHTVTYQEILKGNGFGLEDVKPSIEMAFEIRNAKPVGLKGEYHPFLKAVTGG